MKGNAPNLGVPEGFTYFFTNTPKNPPKYPNES
jgi:hypothetical protein